MVLALGGIIGLATSLWAYQWLQDVTEQTRLDVEARNRTVQVAVAAADLSWGAVLADDAVRVVPFPAGAVPEGHFASAETLKGRVVIVDVKQHEPILESKLAPATVTSGGVAAVTHPNKRAVAVKVDDVIAVGGFIKPGDRVDVIATMRRPGETDDPVTKVVLENVTVLAMGQNTGRAAQTDKAAKDQDTKPSVPSVMTLEVTPEEAEQLALASTEGKVQLALRSPQSTTTVNTAGATISSLLASYGGETDLRKDRSPTPSNRAQARTTARPARLPAPPWQAGSPADGSARGKTPVAAAAVQPIIEPSATPSPAAKGPPPVSVEVIKGMTRTDIKF